MRPLLSLLAALAIVASGCISTTGDIDPAAAVATEGLTPITPVRDRASLEFRTDESYSYVLREGAFGILPALSVFVDVPVPVGQGLPTQRIHMGVFLPEIEGCDWSAAQLPARCKVPVIADVGPYYGEPLLGDVHATEPANRLGKFLIENFVPHGYAVAQVSVMGTGDSGGCMDLMGEVEQAGVQAAVDYLGTTPWSNGAVGLIGRSYDGSTPWEAAMNGSPHLKTVVPISGLYGQHDLMWRNGSAELRGPGVLWGLYYAFTYTGNEGNPTLQAQQILENLVCPDTQVGLLHGLQAYATGDKGAVGYWEERSFKDEVLANYRGSVYFIHGLQDWNVDPHMAFPFYQELEAQGLEMKGLFGQWGHHYPDRPGEHDHLRWDWAQDLLEWFDHYLKGTGAKPELHVEVQDDAGRWRIEETYPPRDARLHEIPLEGHGEATILPASTPDFSPDRVVRLKLGAFEEDLLLAGMPQLHAQVTPLGPGGQLYAELRDATEGRRLGHAIMDLRFAAGGQEMRPVVPGQAIVAHMEFFAMDSLLPAGHELELVLSATGRDYLPSAVGAPVRVDVQSGASVLRLPLVERGEMAFFMPPGV